MDWAAMVLQMYKMWGQRRGYKVTVMDEMAGEVAGIKVHHLATSSFNFKSRKNYIPV